MSLFGRMAMWAAIMPFAMAGMAIMLGAIFFAGWGAASLLTDNHITRAIFGLLALTMALGALMGSRE